MASPTESAASFRTAQEGSPKVEPEAPKVEASIDVKLEDSKVSKESKDGLDPHEQDAGIPSPYRPVRDIPYQLRDHIRVFLEEKMYGEAIQLLTSLAAAGGSDGQNLLPAATTNTSPTETPIWLPPPNHLAVLASLAVHPAYTTRPQDGTDLRVAGHAMQYLRHVLSVAGPVGAEMATAFAYRDARGQRPSTAATIAARARARAAGNGTRQNKNGAESGAEDGRTGRPRRQLRASAGWASLKSGDYVDSQTMSWSDDDDGDWGPGGGGGGTKKKTAAAAGKSKSSSRRRGGDRDRGNDSMDMGGHDGRNGGITNGDDANDEDDDFDAEDNDEDAVSGRMATRDGVWQRGQNFWRVTAWALGCSIQEPARWRCWQPWLTLMVDVVEADLAERLADDDDDLYDSLLFQYLCEDGGVGGGNSTTHLRRIAAAILADGSQPAQAREVFDKETVLTGAAAGNSSTSESAASNPTYNRPKRVLDLDNDKFGDYSDDDESAPSTPESSPSPSPSPFNKKKVKLAPAKTSSKRGSRSSAVEGSADAVGNHPGFLESLPLRRRLFNLVALGAVHFASAFATTDAVYRSFAEVLREAEISVFAAFIASPPPAMSSQNLDLPVSSSHINSPTPDDVFVGLLRHILFTYLPTSAPKPHIVDPVAAQSVSAVAALSPRVLERCFLPFAANTVLLSANVRMALALESLFRLVWQPTTPTSSLSTDEYPEDLWSPALQTAAETGVRARENRARSSASASTTTTTTTKQKSAIAVEAYGRDLMQRSGRRLLAMVQLARMDAGEPEMVIGDL